MTNKRTTKNGKTDKRHKNPGRPKVKGKRGRPVGSSNRNRLPAASPKKPEITVTKEQVDQWKADQLLKAETKKWGKEKLIKMEEIERNLLRLAFERVENNLEIIKQVVFGQI